MPVKIRGQQPNPLLVRATVDSVVELTEDLFLMDLVGFPDEFSPRPGTFLHLKVSEGDHPLLRRPISIQSYIGGVVRLLVREVGIGTAMLRRTVPGNTVDALGPLGAGFSPVTAEDRVLMVGGGVGVAPLVYCCHTTQEGGQVDFCYGAKTAAEIQDLSILRSREESLRFHVSTDDGSAGCAGFCTEVAAGLLEKESFTKVFTCGPWAMMRKVADLAQKYPLPLEASLEVQMGCGLGACLGCVYYSTGGDYIRACIDGPVVDGHTVRWDER
jgi:dihydroorotate dehydrogenase electron transfer subunit